MKKILFIQSKFDFSQYFDEKIFTNTDEIEFTGIKYLNKPAEFFSKYKKIFNCDYFDSQACSIIKKANSVGVDTFLLMDGIYDWANSNLNPVWKNNNTFFDVSFYNLVYCIDSHTASYFNLIGIKTDLYKPPRVFKLTEEDRSIKNKIIVNTRKKILLTTSNTPYFNNIEFIRIINIYKGIIEWSKLNSVDIYFRIYNEKFISELGIKKEFNLTEGPIDNYLNEMDILITTPSSISVTAVMLDKPFIHIIYRDTPMAFQAAWQIFNKDMIPDVLKSALNKEEIRMMHQRTIIPHFKINTETKKIGSQNKTERNLKFSKISLIMAIIKANLKGIYYKLFKYK